MITLQLYSRPQCHLCETLMGELEPLVRGIAEVDIVDISEDPDLARRYGLRIPVLVCDGEELSVYRLDAERVRAFLATRVG